jgi:hypothetical protein
VCAVDASAPDVAAPDASMSETTGDSFAPDVTTDSEPVKDAADGSVARTFTATFTSGALGGYGTSQCSDWEAFRASLDAAYKSMPTYLKVTISGSKDPTGVTCTGPTANDICTNIQLGATGSFMCDGKRWNLGNCGSSPGLILELNAGSTSTCACDTPGYTVRPCLATKDWGGVNTATCMPPSQTITVTCE